MPGLAIQTFAGFRFPVSVNVDTVVAAIFIIHCAIGLVELFLNAGVNLVTKGFSLIPLFFALACLLRAHRAVVFAINSDTSAALCATGGQRGFCQAPIIASIPYKRRCVVSVFIVSSLRVSVDARWQN